MNKLLKPLTLFALLPLLAACSQDENLPAQPEEVTMTFTAQLPAEAATRADAEPPANTLVVGIYEVITGADPKCVKTDTHTITSNTPEVTVTLIKGTTYQLVFWAYNKPTGEAATAPYNVEDLTAITINADAAGSYDAFRGLATAVGGATNNQTSVTLYRPLAQVNIATTVADYNAAVELKHTPATATLTLTGVPKTYNALKGEVTGTDSIDLTFTADITAPAEEANDTDAVPFVSGYTFAQEPTKAEGAEKEEAQKITCKLAVADDAETPETFFDEEYKIPIQPNYRTNISGRLMTGSVSYEVTLSTDTTKDNNQTIE